MASCPALLPSTCVPGTSPTTWVFSPGELTDPSIYGSLFALSLQGSFLCFLHLRYSLSPWVTPGGDPSSVILSLCGSPQSIKSSFVTQKEIDTLFSKMAILFHIQKYMRSPVFLHPCQHLGRSLPNLSYMGVRYPFKYLNFNGF